jgi:hypothetical protein
MLRRVAVYFFVLAGCIVPARARAADRAALDLEAAAMAGLTQGQAVVLELQVAVGYRPNRSYSLGFVGSVGEPAGVGCAASASAPLCDMPTWTRGALEARTYPLATQHADAWLGLELGGEHESAGPESRWAPLLGMGMGISYLPIPALSLGLEGRARFAAFDHQTNEVYAMRGAVGGVYAGFVLGVRVPLGD